MTIDEDVKEGVKEDLDVSSISLAKQDSRSMGDGGGHRLNEETFCRMPLLIMSALTSQSRKHPKFGCRLFQEAFPCSEWIAPGATEILKLLK